MRVYISGPINGLENGNKVSFRLAHAILNGLGHYAVNPHDIEPHVHSGACPSGYASADGHSSACYLRADLQAMLKCDAVLLLAGWEQSIGASLERQVAVACGLPVFTQTDMQMLGRATV